MSYRVKLEYTCDGNGYESCPHTAKAEGFAEVSETLGGNAVKLDTWRGQPEGWDQRSYVGDLCPECAKAKS